MKSIASILMLVAVVGCHELSPKQQATLDLFECRAHALLPYAGEVFDVEQTVREIAKGQTDLAKVLGALELGLDDIAKVQTELSACEPAPPAVVAPPPAYGDKVL